MVTKQREDLHRLLDDLPESELDLARGLLEVLRKHARESFRRALEEAPEDDEPLTEEDLRAIAEAKAEVARGNVVSWEQVQAELRELEKEETETRTNGEQAR